MSTYTKLIIANKALRKVGAKVLTTFGEDTPSGNSIDAAYDLIRDEVLTEHPWSFAQERAVLADMTKPDVDDWVTATAYAVDDEVEYSGTHYTCLIAHTSDVFTVDLTAVRWETTTDWETAKTYSIDDQVYHTGVSYSCLELHTSGIFATDLTAVKWIISEIPAFDEDDIDVVYKLPSDFLKLNFKSDKDAIVKVENNRIVSDTEDLKIRYTYSNDDPTMYFAQFITALVTRLANEICFELTESTKKTADLLNLYRTIDLPNATSADSQQGTADDPQQDEWERARGAGTGSLRVTSGVWHPID